MYINNQVWVNNIFYINNINKIFILKNKKKIEKLKFNIKMRITQNLIQKVIKKIYNLKKTAFFNLSKSNFLVKK